MLLRIYRNVSLDDRSSRRIFDLDNGKGKGLKWHWRSPRVKKLVLRAALACAALAMLVSLCITSFVLYYYSDYAVDFVINVVTKRKFSIIRTRRKTIRGPVQVFLS